MVSWVRRSVLALIVAVAMVTLASNAAPASADQRDFTLINNSGNTIVNVYVTAWFLEGWGDDILGRDVLYPGESVDILFSRYDGETGNCLYDILVESDNGAQAWIYEVDLCSTTTVTYS